jgi:serine/threonine-protein kinase
MPFGVFLMFSKDQMVGKYQIIDRIGAGGFGTVYLALDRLLNRKVALKVPHEQGGEMSEIMAALNHSAGESLSASLHPKLREPVIMAQLKHPNIVELITVEENNGSLFMVMEYVQGESLDRQIRQERGIKPQKALDVSIGVCSAIVFAHSHQVLHRDLRPANILMTNDGFPKVTDFGTSRVLELQMESFARTRIGSPPYMAPEHFRGRAVFQSDLWSVGISIYEMLTGTVPFYDIDPLKIAQAFTTKDIIPPHVRNHNVPKPFSDVVMKCLKVKLGDRYISAQELLKDLNVLKGMFQRETRPLPNPQQVPPPSPVNPPGNQGGHQTLCRFCYQPMPRMTTICPRCREKN